MASLTLAILTAYDSPHDEGNFVLVHGAEAGRVVVGLGGAALVGAFGKLGKISSSPCQ